MFTATECSRHKGFWGGSLGVLCKVTAVPWMHTVVGHHTAQFVFWMPQICISGLSNPFSESIFNIQ